MLPPEAHDAIRACASETPDWRPWLMLLELALAAADQPAWREATVILPGARPADMPLLHGAEFVVSGAAAGALVAQLVASAAPASRPGPDVAFALDVVRAGISQSAAAATPLADRLGVETARVATIAHFAAMPLLLHAAAHAHTFLPVDWNQGCCPVCGAWPVLAELRGLERQRVLRCGRCATAWSRAVLRCTFCDERDHRRQGSLVPQEGGEFLRIETCSSCRGYLKCFTTLRAKPAWSLALDDLRSLPLELKAVERGFSRPATSERMPAVALRAAPEAA